MNKKMLLMCAIMLQIGCMSYAAEEKEKDAAGNDIKRYAIASRWLFDYEFKLLFQIGRSEIETIWRDRVPEQARARDDIKSCYMHTTPLTSIDEPVIQDHKRFNFTWGKAALGLGIICLMGKLIWRR